jgi:DNA polymerase I-like protein with 3'-5' exonuclease and polymerase domains
MLMHYLLDERGGTHDLAYLCQRYLNDVDYEKEMMNKLDINDKGELWKAPRHITHRYVARDADRPLRLYHILKNEIEEEFS